MGGNSNKKSVQAKKNNSNNSAKSNIVRKKKDAEIETLEETNSFDIIIDDKRLKDKDSLDVSFVEGKRKKKKAAQQAIEILEEVRDYEEEERKEKAATRKRSDFVSTFFIIIFSFILGFLICYMWARETDIFKEIEKITKTVTETKVIVDENIVFLGDSIFECYDLDKYFEGVNTVNSGISGNTSQDILDNMYKRVYRYNPSKVVLLIGTNDLNKDVEPEKVVENIGKIIDGIKKNRPYADIYVQSVYPVNRSDADKIYIDSVGDRKNSTIKGMNENIKNLCEEKKVTYMNIYDVLVNEDGELELDYTTEGLHITDAGYEVITNEINKIWKEEKASK